MGKYDPLYDYLSALTKKRATLSFSSVENILGFLLPKSARAYREWWGNQEHGPQAQSWQLAGWHVEDVNLDKEIVVFLKGEAPRIKAKKKIVQKEIVEDNVLSKFHSWDVNQEIGCSLGMEWRPLGIVILDKNARLTFPKSEKVPAIYRFRILKNGRKSLYVGETSDLRRRFGNYRNPGATQQTSLRINAALRKALIDGAEISVSAIIRDAWIDKANKRQTLALSSKVVRCLLENLTILDGGGADIDNLNRAKL